MVWVVIQEVKWWSCLVNLWFVGVGIVLLTAFQFLRFQRMIWHMKNKAQDGWLLKSDVNRLDRVVLLDLIVNF